MERKLVFLDVDGTLAGWDGKVPFSAREACRKAKEAGHLLCIATGRQYHVIGEDLLSMSFDGLISAGGGRIDVDHQMIAYAAFNRDVLAHIIEYFEKRGVGCTFERSDCLLASKRVFEYFETTGDAFSEIIDFYITFEHVVKGELDASYTDVAKVIFCDIGDTPLDEVKREFAGECEVFRGSMPFYGKNSGEIGPLGVDKGTAVDKVLRYYGIRKENSYAIGDGDNDRAMFSHCGYGIAMGNGDAELKAAADYVTDTVENAGIMKAFEHYSLI
ncbi:putative 5-amino-6-(5-phospho-D-ribitylamino)uracil phosphatase YcsE [Hollandina sp. SP2]